jgi:hypothetical protein
VLKILAIDLTSCVLESVFGADIPPPGVRSGAQKVEGGLDAEGTLTSDLSHRNNSKMGKITECDRDQDGRTMCRSNGFLVAMSLAPHYLLVHQNSVCSETLDS